jgi:hypothetical protein
MAQLEPDAGPADPAAMKRELEELLTTARVDELTPAVFLARLESIHRRYLVGLC